jgi:hypothetical protein
MTIMGSFDIYVKLNRNCLEISRFLYKKTITSRDLKGLKVL